MKSKMIVVGLIAVLVLNLFGCNTGESLDKEKSKNNVEHEVEYRSLLFDSTDKLSQAIKDYPSAVDDEDYQLYKANRFDELVIDYYPQIVDSSFCLLNIEVNPYNVFYYYVPLGADSFDYAAGIVVTFPREKEATVETVKEQFAVSTEPDGSVFVPELHSWFIPLGESYYEITFPTSLPECKKDILQMVKLR